MQSGIVRRAGTGEEGRQLLVVRRDADASLNASCWTSGGLPHFVEWIERPSGISLPRLLRQVVSDSRAHSLLVVDGKNTYHPVLFRQACEWGVEDGGAFFADDSPQIHRHRYAFGRFRARCGGPMPIRHSTINELHLWPGSARLVDCAEVNAEMWQRVVTEEDRIAAERKRDRWLVKPTDGNFARFNRRISVPISRQLIKLPITPNMVSLFTLGVGLPAGLLFARALTGTCWPALCCRCSRAFSTLRWRSRKAEADGIRFRVLA